MKSRFLFIALQLLTSLLLGTVGAFYLVDPISGFTMGIPETLSAFYLFGLLGILIVGYIQCKTYNASSCFLHTTTVSVLWWFVTALIISLLTIFIYQSKMIISIPIIIVAAVFNLHIFDKRKMEQQIFRKQ